MSKKRVISLSRVLSLSGLMLIVHLSVVSPVYSAITMGEELNPTENPIFPNEGHSPSTLDYRTFSAHQSEKDEDPISLAKAFACADRMGERLIR